MSQPLPSFGQASLFWLKLGFISFGGPAGQIAIMHRELVEQRRWISDARFLHALNYCMLLPGPEAQQLATYLGWLMHRTWGGIVAGGLFVLPSFFMLVALSWLYLHYGQQPLVAAMFAGIKPAVAALVVHAAYRLGTRTLTAPLAWAIALAALLMSSVLRVPFPFIIGLAALIGWAGLRAAPAAALHDTPTPPHARFCPRRLAATLAVGALLWLTPMVSLWLLGLPLLTDLAGFFTRAALLTFGGAYAVLPYVHQAAVEHYGWLTTAQMIDGLALGETTPGPLIMVVSFVGYVAGHTQAIFGAQHAFAAGVLASAVATYFTFLPSFLFIFAGGPLVESSHKMPTFASTLKGISAAVVGVIASLALFFGQAVLAPQGTIDPLAVIIALFAALALMRFKRGVMEVILLAAVAGLARGLLAFQG